MISGFGTESTSGSIIIRTLNAGTKGVSGEHMLSTGTTSSGASGDISIGTGTASTGDGGDISIVVGDGNVLDGGHIYRCMLVNQMHLELPMQQVDQYH